MKARLLCSRKGWPFLFGLTVSLIWLGIVIQQHALVDKLLFKEINQQGNLPTKRSFGSEKQQAANLSKEQGIFRNKNTNNNKAPPPTTITRLARLARPQTPIAFWNGLPLTLIEGSPQSVSYCLDETPPQFTNISWQFRTCRYTNLCFHMQTYQYGLVGGASNPQEHVALGGINPRWDVGSGEDRGSWKVKWAPETFEESVPRFYQLPDDILLVPFSSFAGHNVGHLLWDDFYSIFKILQIHGFHDNNKKMRLLPIRHVLDDAHKLYATCDIRRNKRLQCMANFVKFLPLLNVSPEHFSTNKRANFSSTSWPKSQLVCSKHGMAGLGMWTDHGKRDHGWERQDAGELVIPHNLGKGSLFWDFRTFILNNLQMQEQPTTALSRYSIPRISFSILSSRDWDRRVDLSRQIDALKQTLPQSSARIESFALWNMTLPEQLQTALDSNIFVSTCGGASITATFLPRGASLILFYNETGGLDFETFSSNGAPARLDWDLLNNAAHLRVHWLPMGSMNSADDLQLFVKLIQHELKSINQL